MRAPAKGQCIEPHNSHILLIKFPDTFHSHAIGACSLGVSSNNSCKSSCFMCEMIGVKRWRGPCTSVPLCLGSTMWNIYIYIYTCENTAWLCMHNTATCCNVAITLCVTSISQESNPRKGTTSGFSAQQEDRKFSKLIGANILAESKHSTSQNFLIESRRIRVGSVYYGPWMYYASIYWILLAIIGT